jgi:hypothetical protein
MRKLIKLILGVTIALITTISLHMNVGQRFHDRGFRYLGHPNFYGRHLQIHEKMQAGNIPQRLPVKSM